MNRMLPEFDTMKFTDIWDNAAEFISDYKSSGLYDAYTDTNHVFHPENSLDDATATKLFYLLYARYGNSPIANFDITQFQYKVFSIIFEYGPTWKKQLEVQTALRDLDAPQIQQGSFAMYNQALNPSTAPATDTTTPLTYINQQNTTRYTKSPLEGYATLLELLSTDVTKAFIDKFKVCFKVFVKPERPLLYVTDLEEDETDGN